MKLQQLRYLVEVAKRGLNVSDAAAALHTSQPGISKQIKLLEDELGVVVFERNGKRLTGVTEPGQRVLDYAQRVLRETQNLKRVGEEYAAGDSGTLAVATTHTQARYVLPAVVKQFVERYPKVRLQLHQGSPTQVADWVAGGEASLGIATEALDLQGQLVTLPCYQWSHMVVAPKGHPILARSPVTVAMLADYPLITYDATFTGRSHINRAFERARVAPNVVLTAIDADVIKTYVELGLGLGIIAEMAFDPLRDAGLQAVAVGHLFESNVTRLGVRHDAYLRQFEFDFIELLAPRLTRKTVLATLAGAGGEGDAGL
ncbi:MAG: CysB family HTH-type transcriptional regulator [Rhodocyclales bacterium]|nr:CysB family HTH-type transcriptional regulator [Rhodocyclales bacterium]